MQDKQLLIEELQKLYKQNIKFLEKTKSGKSKFKISAKTILQFEKLNVQLNEYIQDLYNGLDGNQNLKDWCNFFSNVLLNDNSLDDDNFHIGW